MRSDIVAGVVFAAVVALLALVYVRRAIAAAARLPSLEVAPAAPRDAALLGLEAQLEHAPVALFRIDSGSPEHLAPVNASARRLLAPGRASDVDQLRLTLAGLAAGQRRVIDFDTGRGIERALATANALTVEGKPQRLFALLPMEDELEAEAMQAWQKLVHVLTHEIMNSLTPVASLSRTSRDLLAASVSLPPDLARDLDIALDAISRRADSLAHFVGGYRSLAAVPEARPQRVVLHELFARMSVLVAPAWQARGGRAVFAADPESLEMMADPGQLEQALFNLVKNAAEATAAVTAPEVAVTARLAHGGRLRIEVCDNGPGVQDDLLAHIFTPFFSTRQSGGGIGLAMVRQLVHRNGGSVRYAKSLGRGARFILTF
ncbi:MAG TPA: sensor histidine kinase [Telluria sp.]